MLFKNINNGRKVRLLLKTITNCTKHGLQELKGMSVSNSWLNAILEIFFHNIYYIHGGLI